MYAHVYVYIRIWLSPLSTVLPPSTGIAKMNIRVHLYIYICI
jgi:hypothetical protein